MNRPRNGPPLAIVGPTASGKSALALALARCQPGWELVSIDSMQVYRGLDIGTAKPSPIERDEIPHHLLDVVEPHEEWSVADLQRHLGEVKRVVAERCGRLLYVGGTGLYLRACVDGLDLPGRWPEMRAALEARAAAEGPRTLHRELAALDPQAAARIEPDNTRRIVRALEVVHGSGRSFSGHGAGLDRYPPVDVVQVGLRWERAALERRIAQRVHAMIDAGWCDEVRRAWSSQPPPSRTAEIAVGYRELAGHLAGNGSLESAVEAIVVRTRQLAARQMRWFRRDPRIRWFDVADDPVAEVLPHLMELVRT